MTYIKMLSIEGLEFAILGTGSRGGGEEVLVYDGYAVEKVADLSRYVEELEDAGMLHLAPIFVYLDEEVRAEICRTDRWRRVH